jgi:thymidine kinase
MESTVGYLEIISGPMYSGKTSKLLELYKQFQFCEMPTLVINYAEDNRYSETLLSTHDQVMIPCEKATNLAEIANICEPDPGTTCLGTTFVGTYYTFLDAKVILINEGQFFKDIVAWVKAAVDKYEKIVYVCGLDGDYQRNCFGDWLQLIPFCDNHIKLHSFCSGCKRKPAIFSFRVTHETEQKVIGSANYLPLCRACFKQKTK